MGKVKMGPQPMLYPMPALLIGANVNGKANFMTAAWGGIACGDPPMVSVALRHPRYTLRGIRETETFSVNVPSADLVKEVDFCGIVTGEKVDKVHACKFKVFYGIVETAPMVQQCPVNLECRVEHLLDLGSHVLVIGRIEETYVSGKCFTGEKPDIDKINPLIYTTLPSNYYHSYGQAAGKAFKVGLELK